MDGKTNASAGGVDVYNNTPQGYKGQSGTFSVTPGTIYVALCLWTSGNTNVNVSISGDVEILANKIQTNANISSAGAARIILKAKGNSITISFTGTGFSYPSVVLL